MNTNRISDEAFSAMERVPAPVAAGFVVVPAAAVLPMMPMSPLQCLYQQIYEQAVASTQKPVLRDLFAIMN